MDLAAQLNDLVGRVNDIVAAETYSDFLLERVFRMQQEIVGPVAAHLRSHAGGEEGAREIEALFRAVEEYVVCFRMEPDRRAARRKRIEGLKAIVRRKLLGAEDQEGEIELLLDELRQWQWKTSLDAEGRLVYATQNGKEVPARGVIAEKAGPMVIGRAVKALRPYSERVRPRDVRGEAGGLVKIEDARRVIAVGDLHGRYDNLEMILKDKNNLRDISEGAAHLVFTGDAIHPPHSLQRDSDTYVDSFCTMLLIITLKAENPFNVHYLVGNHDHSHIGGRPAGKGDIRQDMLFERFAIERFGPEVFEYYRTFVRLSPAAIKLRAPNGWMLMVHAGLTPRVLSEAGLININVKGPQGPELTELLWSRNYADRDSIARCLRQVDARLLVVGHTPPTRARIERYGLTAIAEDAFAHVHHLQVILNAQTNTFGYLDVDLARALPDRVEDLLAPNGVSAFRVLRRRVRRPESPGASARPS